MAIRPIQLADAQTIERLLEVLNTRLREVDQASGGFDGDLSGKRLRNVGTSERLTDGISVGEGDQRYIKRGEAVVGAQGPPGDPGFVTVKKTAGLTYAGAVIRAIEEKLGEQVSVLDFAASGNGVVDDGPAIQAAIDAVFARGGGTVLLPGGYTFRVNSSLTLKVNVNLVGQGFTSIIKRGANMADGRGVVHVSGGGNILRDFQIEGDVTTTATLAYEAFSGDPRDVILTKNTSVWLDRVTDVQIDNILFSHSGGYSIYCDRSSRVRISRNFLRNCRPHTFGTNTGPTAGLLHFGGWNSGILIVGDGVDMCDDIVLRENGASRITGTHIWSWAPVLTGNLHTGIVCVENFGRDIGRDGILIGAAVVPVVMGNIYHRIGYITSTDTGGAGVPRWLRNHWAVGVDSSGIAQGAIYKGNAVISAIGGYYDLDGLADSLVNGNVAVTPEPGTAQYTEDRIAEWVRALEVGEPGYPGTTPVQSYGFNLGDTQNNVGGRGAVVSDNWIAGCGAGAIRMYGAIKAVVTANRIDHPANALFPPIALGRGGAGVNQGCQHNVVTANFIFYEPAAAVPAIFEDATLGNLDGPNHVVGNFIFGANCFEFQAHSSSGSSTAAHFTTASPTSARAEMRAQVEGTGATTVLKLYALTAAAVAQVMSLTKSGLMNVSDNGAAGTGAVMLGNRTTVAFPDTFAGRHFVGDGFIAFKGDAFSAVNADSLDASWFLLRKGATQWEQSVSVAAGARVWTAVGSGGGGATPVPGSDTWLVFNDGGLWGADSGLRYDKALNLLAVDGSAGQAGVALAAGWMQAPGLLATGSASDAINAPTGGVTALSHIAIRNDGVAGFTLARTAATARTWGMGIDSAGQWFLRDETAGRNNLLFDTATGRATFAAQVVVGGAVSGSGLLVQDGYIESTEGFYSPVPSFEALKLTGGGGFALSFRASNYMQMGQFSGFPVLTPGDVAQVGLFGYDFSVGRPRWWNGVSMQDFGSGGGGVTSVSSFNSNLTASPTTGAVTLNFSASPTFSSLLVSTAISAGGVVTSNGGFNYTGFASNGIQSQTGGIAVRSVNIADGGGGWQPAIDASRNHFGLTYKSTGNPFLNGDGTIINTSGAFIGAGVDVKFNGVGGSGFNVWNGSFYEFGQTFTETLRRADGGVVTIVFKGGIPVQRF